MKTVYDIMEENDSARKMADFMVKQKQPYEFKVRYAEIRAHEFVKMCDEHEKNYHVSVGGLDSIVLLLFLRKIGIACPAISVSHLEDRSIQKIHKQLGVERLPSAKRSDGSTWKQPQIIREFGFPVLSKEIAAKIELLQNASEKNATVRHAIITGETGVYGGNRKGTRMKLPQKWLNLFAGYGVSPTDVNALTKAIEDDDALYTAEAIEKGITPQQVKAQKKMQREMNALRAEIERRDARDKADEQYMRWVEQAKGVKGVYGNFELREELANPEFARLLNAGIDMKTAFEVIHQDELIPAAMQAAAKAAASQAAKSAAANAARPMENGTSKRSAAHVRSDVNALGNEDIDEVIRRVKRGEKISFSA